VSRFPRYLNGHCTHVHRRGEEKEEGEEREREERKRERENLSSSDRMTDVLLKRSFLQMAPFGELEAVLSGPQTGNRAKMLAHEAGM